MTSFKIYLAGGMKNISKLEQTIWREEAKKYFTDKVSSKTDLSIFNPYDYYNYEIKKHDSEKEILEFELNHLRSSNLVIVNFNSPNSIGTSMELAIAYENRIPIIGLNLDNNDIHPWLKEVCLKIFEDDFFIMLDYVNKYFIWQMQ